MADGVWTFELCDQDDVVLDDITDLVTATVSPRLNRPYSHVLQSTAADSSVWKTPAADGLRALSEGIRTIKAKRNGVLIANAEIWRLDYNGDENTQQVQISCFDSMIRAGFRLVRDSIGRVADWDFPDSITAGTLVRDLLQNSISYDDALRSGQVTAPRRFPVDATAGPFTAATDVAEQLTDGPTLLGDLIYTRICDTGVADVVLTPTDTTAGSPAGVYGKLSCVDQAGIDRTLTVHFDYDAGANNVKAIRRSFDMATCANWLRYLLTPKLSPDHWRGSLESVDAALGTTSYRDAEFAAAVKYGNLLSWQAFDSDANNVREFYRALWKAESTLRVNPRQLLYLTPAGDSTFEPFADYGIGDLVAANVGDSVGPALSNAVQRIYGFDVTVDVNGVESPGELIASPDGTSF